MQMDVRGEQSPPVTMAGWTAAVHPRADAMAAAVAGPPTLAFEAFGWGLVPREGVGFTA
jgi:hypothetical protein